MKVKMNSFQDSAGKWFIDCSECKLGGNGSKSCSAGWTINKPKRGGCYMGNLLENYVTNTEEGRVK